MSPTTDPPPAPRLAPADRVLLLAIARAALRHRLGLGPAPEFPGDGPLAVPRGAFVTLRVRGELRGCIGTFSPQSSLAATVARVAVSAATEDPRFAPIAPEEFDDLDVHISALDPRRPMRDPGDLVVGRDGVVVELGWNRGALLPQVAVEEGWSPRTFLERTCLKAGLPPDAWCDRRARVELFSVEEMGTS
jgi:AmmeMemoRadiSam system protein A